MLLTGEGRKGELIEDRRERDRERERDRNAERERERERERSGGGMNAQTNQFQRLNSDTYHNCISSISYPVTLCKARAMQTF